MSIGAVPRYIQLPLTATYDNSSIKVAPETTEQRKESDVSARVAREGPLASRFDDVWPVEALSPLLENDWRPSASICRPLEAALRDG